MVFSILWLSFDYYVVNRLLRSRDEEKNVWMVKKKLNQVERFFFFFIKMWTRKKDL